MTSAPIERASPTDLMELASDAGGAPMQVGAVLVLGAAAPAGLPAVRDAIAERMRAIPRLRQHLVATPPGCGRPVWVDVAEFDIRDHVRELACPGPADEPALLALAAELMTERLPRDRPLWAATLVSGLAGGRSALVVVFHHVLADGIGGLAVLARLVDGAPEPPAVAFPRRAPAARELLADALLSRVRAVGRLAAGVRRLRSAAGELGTGRRAVRPPRCSLNRPTGPRRALAVARADLAAVRAAGKAHGATVNDVVLAAVAGALHAVLRSRGETADTFVVSVPVSARRADSTARLGNEVGVMPVAIPAAGDPSSRLTAIGRITSSRKSATPGASAALLGPAFRALARIGALRWFIDRQHLVTTFVTNLRGPDRPLSFLGAPVTAVIPVGTITGNVTVAFAVLSYAGTLGVTVIADPQSCPDLPVLAAALQDELDVLTGHAAVAREAATRAGRCRGSQGPAA